MSNQKPTSPKSEQDDLSSDTEEPYPEKPPSPEPPNQLSNKNSSNRLAQLNTDVLDDNPESYFKKVSQIIESKEYKKLEESQEINDVDNIEELYDFPPDPEEWKDYLKEFWADALPFMMKPGWDPNWVDKNELEVIQDEIREGRDPPIASFYVPYRKHYPVIPHNHFDIRNAKSVIEELDRIEDFLTWHSFVFADGST